MNIYLHRPLVAFAILAGASTTWLPVAACCGDDTRGVGAAAPSDKAIAPPVRTAAPESTGSGQPTAPRVAFDRVAVIGASVTAGFMTVLDASAGGTTDRISVNLADVVQQTLAAQTPPAASGGNLLFFANPAGVGGRLAKAAAATDPTLVVAIDFPFWFGYGDIASPDESLRLKRLDEGLALLDQFKCPLVIGDFPDMSEAVGKMITKRQMPSPAMLVKLNERVRAWANERPRVALFPLDELVTKLRSGAAITIGSHTWPAGTDLLQSDRLHPTVEGMIALGQQLAETVRTLDPKVDASSFERDPSAVRERLRGVVDAKLAKRLEAAKAAGDGARQ